MWSPSITPSQVLSHSAKGSTWEKHKYIKIVDGNYYYPNSYDKGRTISDLKPEDKDSKSELKDEDVDKIADETIKGKHGNGKDRREKFGSDYARIQNKVNEKLGNKKRHEEEDDDEDKEEEKKDEEEKEEDKEEEEKDKDKDKKKSKGSGSSKKKSSDKDKEKKSKESSSSSSGSKSSKSSTKKKNTYLEEKQRKAKNKATMRARSEEMQKRKQRRMKKNILERRKYLNHSSIWSPTVSADYIYHSAIERRPI